MTTTLTARCVFLGAPGAGKGTQAKNMAQHGSTAGGSIAHISTGDMLRAQVAEGTELGLQAKGYMDNGELVPDQLIIAMVQQRIRQPDAISAWILDGFPRTLPQAEALDESLGDSSPLSHVIYFAVPEAALMSRLTGRRTCGGCGAIWHVETRPTKVEGVCDVCSGQLVQRSDDRSEAIEKRLQAYRAQTAPLLDYYRTKSKSVLREIDADRSPDVVFQELLKLMQ